MIRYRYNQQVQPPALFINVTLRRPDDSGAASDYPAQLDTAADQSVIPARVVQDLQLAQLREVSATGLGGNVVLLPTYLVWMAIHQLHPRVVEVLASSGETYVLLGRDVLNHYRIVLDGPKLVFELE